MFGDSYGSYKAIIMHLNVTWILINSAFFVIIICSVVSMMIFVVCLYSDVFPPQSIGVHLKVLFSHLPHIFPSSVTNWAKKTLFSAKIGGFLI